MRGFACSFQTIEVYCSVCHCQYFSYFFYTPKVKRSEWWLTDSAFLILPLLLLFREKVREDGGKSARSSIPPQGERESDGDGRKWRCRRLGLAKGSPSRNTHTHLRTHTQRKNNTHISGASTTGLCLLSADTSAAQLLLEFLITPVLLLVCEWVHKWLLKVCVCWSVFPSAHRSK